MNKTAIRNILGEIPLTAELDWILRRKALNRRDHFQLNRLQKTAEQARLTAEKYAHPSASAKKVLFFSTLHYWIEQSAFIALVLASQGHKLTLLTLPYSEWHKDLDKFTQRQRILHTRTAIKPLTPFIEHISMFELNPRVELPAKISEDVNEISMWDSQYTLMREEVDLTDNSDRAVYELRLQRNTRVACTALAWIKENRPDVVIVPNGLILEMGVVFRVARYLGIPAVTYEFNDQREQIWLAQNSSIMQQDTDYLVEARCKLPITEDMYEKVADLENARRGARVWGKSKRLWQYVSSQGEQTTRKMIGLDSRPVVMLAANVLGDSLTLGRDIFASSMTEWMTRTMQFFAKKPELQVVVRVHPGETLVPKAKSMAKVVSDSMAHLPEHIHVIGSADKINTYDLIEVADLGLAYTTTVGLETAMNGRPVIVCGETHYRGRGFTLDPNTWDGYWDQLDRVLADLPGHRLSENLIEKAWNYAYRFFFEYPRPFPWRLMNFWDDLETWPLEKVLGEEGQAQFGDTFRFLIGEPFSWKD